MQGFQVVTSDECKFGRVAGIHGSYVIVERGTLLKRKYAVPETFAHADENERTVRLSVSKAVVESAPRPDKGSIDEQAVAAHYGLAEGTPAPETAGEGYLLPDDPGRSAEQETLRAGLEPTEQRRAEIREGADGSE